MLKLIQTCDGAFKILALLHLSYCCPLEYSLRCVLDLRLLCKFCLLFMFLVVCLGLPFVHNSRINIRSILMFPCHSHQIHQTPFTEPTILPSQNTLQSNQAETKKNSPKPSPFAFSAKLTLAWLK